MTDNIIMKSDHERGIQYSFTYQDAVEVLRLVRDSDTCTSLDLQIGDIKLSVTRAGGAPHAVAPAAVSVALPAATSAAPPPKVETAPAAPTAALSAAELEGLVPVRTPTLGVFYRAASPEVPPFVKEGDHVKAEDQVGLLEVMKLFSPVTAGVSGKVVKILVTDNMLVEHGQTLMLIQPD